MLFLILFLLFGGVASADVYVQTNSSHAVIGLSEQNDMVLQSGNTISKVAGTIANLPISGDPTMYNFSNGAFSLNASKVQAQQAAQAQVIAAQTAEVNAKASAIQKIQNALAAASQDTLTNAEIQALIP